MADRKRRQPKLPARVQRVVDIVRGGKRLCLYHHKKPSGESDDRFYFEPGGGADCPEKYARAAIRSGHLKPAGDGLFGSDSSQSWVSA